MTGALDPLGRIAPKPVRIEKRCARCRQTLPLDDFYERSDGGRDCYCRPCRKDYQRRLSARKAGDRRHVRVNARGDVWCNNCQRYLPATSFKRHPSRPHTWWAYCVECTRALDRLRWRGKRREESNAARRARQKAQRRAERMERTEFAVNAVLTLRKRGLTKADVCRLTGLSLTTILELERRKRRGTSPVVERLMIALHATAHLPAGSVPAYRRPLPLPGFAELVARVRPLMDAFPTRSRWKDRGSEAGQ
jgi:transcriptional regulator with XRE-family HTH domain